MNQDLVWQAYNQSAPPMRAFFDALNEMIAQSIEGSSHQMLINTVRDRLADTYLKELSCIYSERQSFQQKVVSANKHLQVIEITPQAIQDVLEDEEEIDSLVVCNGCELIASSIDQSKLESIGVEDPHAVCPRCLSPDLGLVARFYIYGEEEES